MLKKVWYLFAVIVGGIMLQSCSPEHSEIVVAEYGDKAIKMGEFERVYAKNAGGEANAKDDSLSQFKSFLDLYVRYKMKLADAAERGFDKDQSLQDELQDYKLKIGPAYILEKRVVDPALKAIYDKRRWEFRVSHIMTRPDSTGMEGAKQKIQEIYAMLQAGTKSFEDLAREYSSDDFSKVNGGDIYYITSGQIIPEFEKEVYKLEKGQVSEPVESRYGWHIIKVTDKQERIPQIRARHILVDFYTADGQVDTAAAKARVDSVMLRLNMGEDFASLAKEYSDDKGSAENGGDLNFFERRMMVQPFDEAAFNLRVGEISGPVQTDYGFHIIQVTDVKHYGTFEEEKETARNIYKQTTYQTDNDLFVQGLKDKYKGQMNNEVWDELQRLTGDTLKVGKPYWDAEWRPQIKDRILFTVGNHGVSVDTMIAYMEQQFEYTSGPIRKDLVSGAVKKKSGEVALMLEADSLDKVDPTFAQLMDDYRNGIYIFKLQELEVWNKVDLDSAKLAAYHEVHKEKYRWNDRVEFAEIFARNDSVINYYHARLRDGADFDTLAMQYTERPNFRMKMGRYELSDVTTSDLHKEAFKLNTPGEYTKPFPNSNGFSIVKLIKKDPTRLKTFEEAKPEVAGAYQEIESKRLEEEYLKTLDAKFRPSYNYDELRAAFRQ